MRKPNWSCIIYTKPELKIIDIEDKIVFYFVQKNSLGNDRSMGRIFHLNNERITSTRDFYALTRVKDYTCSFTIYISKVCNSAVFV